MASEALVPQQVASDVAVVCVNDTVVQETAPSKQHTDRRKPKVRAKTSKEHQHPASASHALAGASIVVGRRSGSAVCDATCGYLTMRHSSHRRPPHGTHIDPIKSSPGGAMLAPPGPA
jgi:hypothetical protein